MQLQPATGPKCQIQDEEVLAAQAQTSYLDAFFDSRGSSSVFRSYKW
jgi:hypothetical protein